MTARNQIARALHPLIDHDCQTSCGPDDIPDSEDLRLAEAALLALLALPVEERMAAMGMEPCDSRDVFEHGLPWQEAK